MASEAQMMADLDEADRLGDHELAQHIAGQIKAARAPPDEHGPLAYAAHKTASFLPAAAGIAGGVLGGGLGGAVGFPTTGPGGILTTAGGAGIGAGLASSGGRMLQHAIDAALGYEKPDVRAATEDSIHSGIKDAGYTAAGGVVLPTAVAAAGKLAPALDAIGNNLGRRVLSGGASRMTAKQPVSNEAIDAANEAGAFKPWGTTKRAAGVIDAAKNTAGTEEGGVLSALEKQGVTGSHAETLAKQLEAEAAAKEARSLMSPEPPLLRGAAAELRTKPVDAQGRLSLGAQEDMKRELQFQAQKEYDKIAGQYTPSGEAKKAVASRLRQAVEDEVSAQASKAPEEAAAFIPAKQKYRYLAEAGKAAEKGAAQADHRQAFSLTDMLAGVAGSHGGPLKGAVAALASKGLRTFGPSAGTWAAKGGADVLESMAGAPSIIPARVGAGVGAAAAEPAGGKPDLAAILALLGRRQSVQP